VKPTVQAHDREQKGGVRAETVAAASGGDLAAIYQPFLGSCITGRAVAVVGIGYS
jgi:hypothetical protein